MNDAVLAVRMPRKFLDFLTRKAKEQHTSASAIARQAISEKMEREEKKENK